MKYFKKEDFKGIELLSKDELIKLVIDTHINDLNFWFKECDLLQDEKRKLINLLRENNIDYRKCLNIKDHESIIKKSLNGNLETLNDLLKDLIKEL